MSSKDEFLGAMAELVNGQVDNLSQVPLWDRARYTKLATNAYLDLLRDSKGKELESREMRRLTLASAMMTNRWDADVPGVPNTVRR